MHRGEWRVQSGKWRVTRQCANKRPRLGPRPASALGPTLPERVRVELSRVALSEARQIFHKRSGRTTYLPVPSLHFVFSVSVSVSVSFFPFSALCNNLVGCVSENPNIFTSIHPIYISPVQFSGSDAGFQYETDSLWPRWSLPSFVDTNLLGFLCICCCLIVI